MYMENMIITCEDVQRGVEGGGDSTQEIPACPTAQATSLVTELHLPLILYH